MKNGMLFDLDLTSGRGTRCGGCDLPGFSPAGSTNRSVTVQQTQTSDEITLKWLWPPRQLKRRAQRLSFVKVYHNAAVTKRWLAGSLAD